MTDYSLHTRMSYRFSNMVKSKYQTHTKADPDPHIVVLAHVMFSCVRALINHDAVYHSHWRTIFTEEGKERLILLVENGMKATKSLPDYPEDFASMIKTNVNDLGEEEYKKYRMTAKYARVNFCERALLSITLFEQTRPFHFLEFMLPCGILILTSVGQEILDPFEYRFWNLLAVRLKEKVDSTVMQEPILNNAKVFLKLIGDMDTLKQKPLPGKMPFNYTADQVLLRTMNIVYRHKGDAAIRPLENFVLYNKGL